MTVRVDLPMDRIRAICRKYGVAELSVFGSAVREDFGPESDVDFLYVLSPESTIGWEIVDFHDELSEALGREVDIVPKNYLPGSSGTVCWPRPRSSSPMPSRPEESLLGGHRRSLP